MDSKVKQNETQHVNKSYLIHISDMNPSAGEGFIPKLSVFM